MKAESWILLTGLEGKPDAKPLNNAEEDVDPYEKDILIIWDVVGAGEGDIGEAGEIHAKQEDWNIAEARVDVDGDKRA